MRGSDPPPARSQLFVLHFSPRKQFFVVAELRHVPDAHRIQNPIEMIAFVLYHAGIESANGAVDQRTDQGLVQQPEERMGSWRTLCDPRPSVPQIRLS